MAQHGIDGIPGLPADQGGPGVRRILGLVPEVPDGHSILELVGMSLRNSRGTVLGRVEEVRAGRVLVPIGEEMAEAAEEFFRPGETGVPWKLFA